MRTRYPRHPLTFNYVGFHRYFLTFCTIERRNFFLDAETVDLVIEQFLRAASDEGITIIAYCFMPDHVHCVVEADREDSDLKKFISHAKQLSGYHVARLRSTPLWQRYGYERVLRAEEDTRSVVRYVLENPIRAGLTAEVTQHPFIGSSRYSREELIEFAYRSGESRTLQVPSVVASGFSRTLNRSVRLLPDPRP